MATPTLVQVNGAQQTGGSAVTAYTVKGPQAVLSGNAVIVFLQNGAAISPSSVTDDKSNTYTLLVNKDDGNQNSAIYYSLNITNGPRNIIVNYASATSFVSVAWSEWYNIATSINTGDKTSNNGSGTALTAGSFTPTNNNANGGNLILAFATMNSPANTTNFTAGTNAAFGMLYQSQTDDYAIEYFVQATSAALNPDMTMSPTNAWAMVAGAFKAATQGTAPTGYSVVRAIHLSTNTDDTSPFVQSFPCKDGNLLICMWNGAAAETLSGITDSKSNTWLQAGTGSVNGGSGMNQLFYSSSPITAENMTVTFTFTGGGGPAGSGIILLEVVNAGLHDGTAGTTTASGTNSSGTSFTGSTIVPSTVNGLVVAYIGAVTGSASEIIDCSPGNFIGANTVPVINTSPVDNNQGGLVYFNPTAASITVTWTNNGVVIGGWADIMTAFLGTIGVLPRAGLLGTAQFFPGHGPGISQMLMRGIPRGFTPAVPASATLFRKTLPSIGTGVGKRQTHNTE